MPVQPTYPGVYVQEASSGVRTIAGVSTSITAFLGAAKRGPVNKATLILSYSDYERRFGGLSKTSEMSYAVRQFFLNGGSRAVVVRLARDPLAASRTLYIDKDENDVSLLVTALDQGSEGNQIEVRVNYNTSNPGSTFNLIVNQTSPDNPGDSRTETFANVSMNSADARYVVDVVERSSQLIRAERTASLAGLSTGSTLSGELANVALLVDDTHNRFRIAVDGQDPITIQLNPTTDVNGANDAAKLATLCGAIESQANGAFTCAPDGTRILITSASSGENSRVEVLPGIGNDAAARLKLGAELGGTQTDAVAAIRPREIPDHSSVTSGVVAEADLIAVSASITTVHRFQISIDGGIQDVVDIGTTTLSGNYLALMTEMASRIQTAVRSLRPSRPAYSDFTSSVEEDTVTPGTYHLVLSPGSRGSSSSIVITEVAGDALAAMLKLLPSAGAVSEPAKDVMLQGGIELAITDATAYNVFVGSRANREGIYALESVDLFNILCLPGIEDGGILMEAEAYCRERRAFLIADAPLMSKTPTAMAATIAGADLPKSDHAAVYYPWIKISDPLNGGALRTTAPSGTLAGLYARMDANRGVWKAPAGTEASLTGVRGLDYTLTDRENGVLNPLAVNCLRIFPDSGAVSWGARTLKGDDRAASEWKYIPVRRTALFIEESLYQGLKWVVFEPNDEPLWAQIRLNVGSFMNNLFRQGAFQGVKKDDAYFVKCDKETTTQNDINLGIVNIWVGFAPLKPAEFVILYLQQMTGQIQV